LLAAGLAQVDMQLYQDGRHEMLNEHNRQQVYADLYRWINARLQQ